MSLSSVYTCSQRSSTMIPGRTEACLQSMCIGSCHSSNHALDCSNFNTKSNERPFLVPGSFNSRTPSSYLIPLEYLQPPCGLCPLLRIYRVVRGYVEAWTSCPFEILIHDWLASFSDAATVRETLKYPLLGTTGDYRDQKPSKMLED